MTTDLWMLVATGMLSILITIIYTIGRYQRPGGLQWSLGNRESTFVVAPWVERAERAHRNLTENIALFAILILAAHLAGKANAWVALGATMFFCARLAHALLYTAGMVYLRTAAFQVGIVAELLITFQLVRG